MQVTVREIRSGRNRTMSKKFADILVKLKKVTYDILVEAPVIGPVYNTTMLTAKKPSQKAKDSDAVVKPKKRKRKKKAKAPAMEIPAISPSEDLTVQRDKEYLTRVMTAEE